MLVSFDSVCAPSYPDPGFCPNSIYNAPGGATEALPDPDVPSPIFLLHFSFNLHFYLVINSALDSFTFFPKTFSVTLSAISNASSI